MKLCLRSLRPVALSLGLALISCSADQNKKVVKTTIDIATATCVILRGVVANGVVDSICATEEELAPLLKYLVALRKAKASIAAPAPSDGGAAGDAGSSPSTLTLVCEVK
jgi:hypothetical protein